ncbi:hypothetical protein K0U07_04575 [bacterium]|nr:hypothetical protein [bacterium]
MHVRDCPKIFTTAIIGLAAAGSATILRSEDRDPRYGIQLAAIGAIALLAISYVNKLIDAIGVVSCVPFVFVVTTLAMNASCPDLIGEDRKAQRAKIRSQLDLYQCGHPASDKLGKCILLQKALFQLDADEELASMWNQARVPLGTSE